MSEDSLAISMAIFAASYAVPQCDSLDDPGSLRAVSMGSQGGETMGEGITLVDGASALGSSTWGWVVVRPCSMGSTTRRVGVHDGLSFGLIDDEAFFRKRCIANARTTKWWSTLLECWALWSKDLDSGLTRSRRPREYKRLGHNAVIWEFFSKSTTSRGLLVFVYSPGDLHRLHATGIN